MGFVAIIYSSITAGVGNSMIVYDTEKNYHDYRIFTFLACWITAFCVSCFSGLFQPFMKLWMGKELLLPYPLVILLCVYFWVYEYIMMASVYKDAGGIWHEDRFRPLLSGITNLGLNLLTVKFLGLYGIVLSTIVSMVIISAPWTMVCYKCGRNVTRRMNWFSDNNRKYFGLAYCPRHGWLKGKIRVNKNLII